jgi:hypothetical protein
MNVEHYRWSFAAFFFSFLFFVLSSQCYLRKPYVLNLERLQSNPISFHQVTEWKRQDYEHCTVV